MCNLYTKAAVHTESSPVKFIGLHVINVCKFTPKKINKRVSLICKGSPYSITGRRVPELIPVIGSQPAGDVSNKPGGRLPLLSARPAAVTPATRKRAATSFATW